MGTGIGASLITFAPNTLIQSSQMNSNFTSINNSGVSNDGGRITTDGSGNITTQGNITWNGKLTSSGNGGNQVLDATGSDTSLYASATSASVHVLGFALTGKTGPSGTKYFEANSTALIIAGQYKTGGTNSSIATSTGFDPFDYAEVYPCDTSYDSGTIVCIGDNDAFTRCTHDGCHCAMIVSLNPGMCLGNGSLDENDAEHEQKLRAAGVLPLALCGRVVVFCSSDVKKRDVVCSDARGGVRAIMPGETQFSIGFALHDSHEGRVGIVISRGQYHHA